MKKDWKKELRDYLEENKIPPEEAEFIALHEALHEALHDLYDELELDKSTKTIH